MVNGDEFAAQPEGSVKGALNTTQAAVPVCGSRVTAGW
jgi:hypothetical protein